MKKLFKILLWSVFSMILILTITLVGFVYKVKNGFPVFFETEIPAISFPADQKAVLLFSKSTGFRHGESIEAGKEVFAQLAKKNNWFLYSTEEGGVFNADQLARFDVVIFNNSTGRLLNDEQQEALEEYVEQGGKLIGIHGAGDDSHHWDWYVKNLLGSEFSHHAIQAELQLADVSLGSDADSVLIAGLPAKWKTADEWYVFFENPNTKGFTILFTVDGDQIDPSGNLLWIKDKDFGMGKAHPVAWYKPVGKGETFYTSMGHDANAWKQEPFVRMLENAIGHP